MSTTTSYRLSGIALLTGAVLSAVGYILSVFASGTDLQTLISPLSMTYSVVTILGSIFLLVGLPGMYLRQAKRAGVVGLLGFLFLSYVTLFQGIMVPFTSITFIPFLADHQIAPEIMANPPATWIPFFAVSMVGQVLGILLLAIASLRARVFPRWIGWTMVATLVLSAASMIPFFPEALSSLPAVVGMVAMAGFGLNLFTPQQDTSNQTAPVSSPVEARA